MSTALQSPPVRSKASVAPPAPPTVVAAEVEASTPPLYWGDRIGLWFWLGCAAVLVLLHVGDWVSSMFR